MQHRNTFLCKYLIRKHVIVTPRNKRKSGVKRIMFPNFGTGYYYSLSNYFEPEKDGRFAGRTKAMSAILGASEGFFIPDKICERFIFYGWD